MDTHSLNSEFPPAQPWFLSITIILMRIWDYFANCGYLWIL